MLGRDAGPMPSPAAPLEDVSATRHANAAQLRQEIVVSLRRDGPASPDQLARRVNASRTGVLQQLKALQSSGLVSRQTVRHGVGRPRHVYDVTDRAQDLFPANYDGLANGLLAAIEEVGGAGLVDEIFEARRHQLADSIRERMTERVPAGATLLERVRELAAIQDEQGYLCGSVFSVRAQLRDLPHRVGAARRLFCRARAVPGGAGRRRCPRNPHRVRRPQLHLPHKRTGTLHEQPVVAHETQATPLRAMFLRF
ncbi:MAG: winged helix-turn-helix transcriptional regulator [Chloroflexi bacterium]|nr:MAG: winged helix-turn-helix transcriptional regulator [Chloroflexota bacterium]